MWSDWKDQIITIRSIYLHLDRTFLASGGQTTTTTGAAAEGIPAPSSSLTSMEDETRRAGASEEEIQQRIVSARSIWELGVALLLQSWQSHPALNQHTLSSLLTLITRDRQGEHVEKSLLTSVIGMLYTMRLYQTVLEEALLDETSQFYHAESERLIQDLSVSDYLSHVTERLNKERANATAFLHPSTRPRLIGLIEKRFVSDHLLILLGPRGLAQLLPSVSVTSAPSESSDTSSASASASIASLTFTSSDSARRVADLGALFLYCNNVGAREELCKAFAECVVRTGLEIVTPPEKDAIMVDSLLAFKASLEMIVESSFSKSKDFGQALRASIDKFINQRSDKPSELIAKFCDKELRMGSKGRTEDELRARLDAVMNLFKHAHGKDVFQAFYRKDLAKRLLLNKSASVDAEKMMIERIKAEVGPSYTNKLESMFRDIELSKDINQQFQQHVTQLPNKPLMECGVQVLTMGSWPNYTPADISLPEEINQLLQEFRTYYLSRHSNRKLAFVAGLSSCVMRANFPRGRKELLVSGYQASVLLLFNSTPSLTAKQIRDHTAIPDGDLQRTLGSLSLGELKVLNKEPKTRRIDPDDRFEINAQFRHQLLRLTLNTVQLQETKEEQQGTQDRVLQDRGYSIDACLVRVMKARKTLSHAELVSEVFKQLKYDLKPADIKKRIAGLIEREYMERDSENPQVYHYLA